MRTRHLRSMLGASFLAGVALVVALEILLAETAVGASPAPPSPIGDGTAAVRRIDDYASANAVAAEVGGMLLVSIEPGDGSSDDPVGRRLDDAALQRRFATGGTEWVFCRLGIDAGGAALVADSGLVEMRRGPGIFVVDHRPGRYAGRIVSILPRTPGKYYSFQSSHLDEIPSLPEGSLTQRSLILAVRIHPEAPQSTTGTCDPGLCAEAESHSAHQATLRRQGHHGWQSRSQRIAAGRGAASEVCAESWEHQDLLDSCVDCVASWRHSSGHWKSVKSPQAAYGYDIRRGGNGIWYATGIFTN